MRAYPAIVIRSTRRDAAIADVVFAALDGTGVTAVEEIDGGAAIRAFFTGSEDRDRAAQDLAAAMPEVDVETVDVPDENWAERSQASLRAVTVGGLTIAPPWDVSPERAETTIVILPSMGFGTGHHATTRLCLAALQRVQVRKASVLDVGTGSGVLALAAARLGATRVVGIDNDPAAITNALENKALNGNPHQLDLRCTDLEDEEVVATGAFDLVMANLTGGVLLRYSERLEDLTREGGRLILSGLREEEEDDVRTAFDADVEWRDSEDGWVCLAVV